MQSEHSKYMYRCLQLAKLGEGHTAPNPMVGSIIVLDGKIIGEGFHRRCGGPHAEVNAICSVEDETLLKDSTIYVNLEPCSHHGKTPPCADLIIAKGIPRVIIGTLDPNPLVAGSGVKKLRDAGCDVEIGVLHEECRELNRRFFTYQEKKRPYIILKWAQTRDGFVDANRLPHEHGQPTWITDEMARIAVHKQRATEDAILIGTSTAIADNPSLTLREWYGEQPIRLVFDLNQRLSPELNIFDGKAKTIVLTTQEYNDARNTDYIFTQKGNTVEQVIHQLFKRNIQSVIVEGGPITLQYFIDSGYWDETHVYTGFKDFGEGLRAPELISNVFFEEKFNNSQLSVYRNVQ